MSGFPLPALNLPVRVTEGLSIFTKMKHSYFWSFCIILSQSQVITTLILNSLTNSSCSVKVYCLELKVIRECGSTERSFPIDCPPDFNADLCPLASTFLFLKISIMKIHLHTESQILRDERHFVDAHTLHFSLQNNMGEGSFLQTTGSDKSSFYLPGCSVCMQTVAYKNWARHRGRSTENCWKKHQQLKICRCPHLTDRE